MMGCEHSASNTSVDADSIEARVLHMVRMVLALDGRIILTADTPLLGALPEFDSQALIALLAALESEFSLEIGDDEMSAELFTSIATLSSFVSAKLQKYDRLICAHSS